MTQGLRLLIVEDLASDAELMAYELRQANLPFTVRRVENDTDFLREVGRFRPDLILSDYHLPHFNGLAALALAQEHCPAVPFIFVSGAIGEEVAIDTLKRGATDYVLKDRLSRLVPAVKRALREAAERRERREAEEALRESEQRYRLLVKSLPAVVYRGYFDCSVDFVDQKVAELTGYSKEEFDSRRLKWLDLVIPEDQPRFRESFLTGLKGAKSYLREYRIKSKDGDIRWIQERGQIICNPEGRVEYVSGVFFDITASQRDKMALLESEQRLRFLTSQLLEAQEKERKRISMELHDDLGQSLTVMKLQIRSIEMALREDDQPELKRECQELRQYVDGVIDNVRRLSRDLSPAILEDLGLQSALNYLLEGLGKHLTIKLSQEVEDLNSLFPAEAQIVIYRIFQECLNNIAKHAGACQVSVNVRRDGEAVAFTLEDDGAGFNMDQVRGRAAGERGLGLAALDERARMLGGNCKISSQPGRGTKVVCTIPVTKQEKRSATA
ncbi:MAG: PAS domain-containing protein [Deltaproteobacteria bacterium]|nr:PAS domain-containing protein [Deltaproteobacteria bacterium]